MMSVRGEHTGGSLGHSHTLGGESGGCQRQQHGGTSRMYPRMLE